MLAAIPWNMILWAGAGLVALYFLGWELFGLRRRTRNLLQNCVGGLGFAWAASLLCGLVGASVHINLATIACSVLLGIPGAALVCLLQMIG